MTIKTCPVCAHSQLEGKFCVECGMSFSAMNTRTNAAQLPATQENDALVKVSRDAKVFMHFLLQQLKAPSGHFHATHAKLGNSMLSIALFIALTSIAIYKTFSIRFTFIDTSVFQVILYFSIFFLLVFFINLIALTGTAKLFTQSETIPELTRKLGGFYAIPITLSAASLALALIQSFSLAAILLSIAVFIAFVLIPLFAIQTILNDHPKTIDGFHGILFYVSCTIVGGIVLTVFLTDSLIGDLLKIVLG